MVEILNTGKVGLDGIKNLMYGKYEIKEPKGTEETERKEIKVY